MIVKLPYQDTYINLSKVEQIEKGIYGLLFYFNGRIQNCTYPEDKEDERHSDFDFFVDLWKDAILK